MLKNKRILLIIILALALLLVPNMVNAKSTQATETTKTPNGVDVKWEYELDINNEIVKIMCVNKEDIKGTLTIPSTIDGYTVKKLGIVAYDHNNTYYNKGTFEECYGLQGVTIPSTVTEIGADAFRSCTGIQSITIPNRVTSIGESAFSGCTGIKSITIPNSVTSIGNSAFIGCTGLKTIVIPDNVTSLGENALKNCTGLTSVTLSKNLTKINRETFSGCKGLTSVIIPDSVTTIAGYDGSLYGAFEYCTNLTKVLIPDSVATIEKSAFYKCTNLTIYGNDGQVSKQYAEDNKIKFDYIANWDKGTSGSDIAAPTVTNMHIKYSSVMGYYNSTSNRFEIPKGATIQINVEFSEDIIGKTAPTLKIKCGTGSEISITNGVISGNDCIYNYQIKEGDVGLITVVSLTGGDITDAAGNKAELSCPKLIVQYHSDNTAYANSATAVIEKPTIDTTQYISFPFIIFNGKSSLDVKNYNGNYKLYYQFVEINDNQFDELEKLKEKYKKAEITYAEFLTQYKQILPSYNDKSWIETSDGKFEKDLSNFNGTKKFALWAKLVMDTKTVYEAEVYTMDGSGTATNTPDEIDKVTDKDQTEKEPTTDTTIKNDSKLPQTGIALLSLVAVSLIAVAVISKVKYGKYKDI